MVRPFNRCPAQGNRRAVGFRQFYGAEVSAMSIARALKTKELVNNMKKIVGRRHRSPRTGLTRRSKLVRADSIMSVLDFTPGSRFGGSSDFNLLADVNDHQIFTELQRTGVSLPRWWNQILLGRVRQHDV